jgi:hypothetical protein
MLNGEVNSHSILVESMFQVEFISATSISMKLDNNHAADVGRANFSYSIVYLDVKSVTAHTPTKKTAFGPPKSISRDLLLEVPVHSGQLWKALKLRHSITADGKGS